MLLLCKSQGNGFAFICLNLLKASPLADSRKGCLYKRSVIDSSRNLCRSRGSGASSRRTIRANKIVQISRADSICPYPVLFHYSLLVITLSASETTSQPRLTPSQRPLQGRLIDSSTALNLPIHSPIIFSIAFSNSSFCSGRRFCGPFILPPAMRIFFVS